MGCCASRVEVEDDEAPNHPVDALDSRPTSPTNDAVAAITTAGAQASPPRRSNAALRKAKPWRSTRRTWTHAQLARERTIFWDTQVSGQEQIWSALRLAVELARDQGDLKGAKAVLDASGCTIQSNRLTEGVWDERGNLYRIPRWVISDPVNVLDDDGADNDQRLDEDGEVDDDDDDGLAPDAKDGAADEDTAHPSREDKGKDRIPTGPNAATLKARLSDRATDIELIVDTEAPIKRIIKRIHVEAEIPSSTKLKLAYLGKILKDNDSLKNQDWQEGHVLNVLVFG